MSGRKRIALYGGTFDPVHNGHIAVAQKLAGLFALEEVLFIPAHVAPHKRERAVTAPLQRYAMLALATQGQERLRISSIELDAPEKPYTVETLSRLQAELGQAARLFFIMGADSWAEIATWRDWERLLGLTDTIVVTRPGYQLSAEHVTEELRKRVVDLRGADSKKVGLESIESGEQKRIYVSDAVRMNISATEIRRIAREGRIDDLKALVSAPVAEFIRKYKLYR